MRRFACLLAAALLAPAAAGCGGPEGAAPGAEARVYVSAPLRGPDAAGRRLCREARRAAGGADAGELRLRVVCLDSGGPDGRWSLARVGAAARRAAEDSAAVAYLGEPDPRARAGSRPILRAAGIADLGAVPPAAAVREVAAALSAADGEAPRDAVRSRLG